VHLLRSATVRWSVASFALLVIGLVGLRTPGTEHQVLGKIGGFGSLLDGSECYMNVTYEVASHKYSLKSSRDQRWCGYEELNMSRRGAYIPVFFDPSDPAGATLEPRGSGPTWMVVIGGTGIAACGVGAFRRRDTQPG
jgi:hypothetical protein